MKRSLRNLALSLGVLLCFLGQAEPVAPISCSLPAPGQLSLAVYDMQGRMVRELRRAQPCAADTLTAVWDGLDMDGQPVPTGEYEWRGLCTTGLRSEYLFSIGTSVGSQWWPGNHGGPNAVAAAAGSLVVAAATEGPPEIIRCTFAGEVVWARGSFEPARNPRGVAIGGDRVFYLQDSGKIQVLDFATGASVGKPVDALVPVARLPLAGLDFTSTAPQQVTFDLPNGNYFLRFHHGDPERPTGLVEVHPGGMEPWPGHRTLPDKMAWWQLPASAAGTAQPKFLPQIYGNPRAVTVTTGKLAIEFLPQAVKGQPGYWRANEVEVLALPDRIAAGAGQVVLSSASAGVITWLDPLSGQTLARVPVPGVRDVAMAPDGTVLALLRDAVVAVSRETQMVTPRLHGLTAPLAVAADGTGGNVLVLEGETLQQVKRFDARGTCVATFGRRGGRQFGRYNAADFAGVGGLAADGAGGFLVIETHGTPRRTVRCDAAGKVTQEWFGGMDFYAQTAFDPDDPTVAWLRQDSEHVIQVKLDLETRHWYPLAAYRWTEAFDPAAGRPADEFHRTRFDYGPWLQRNPSYQRMRCLRRDLDSDGTAELLLEFHALPLLLVHDVKADRLRPLAALGVLGKEYFSLEPLLPVEQLPPAWSEAIRRAGGEPADGKTRSRFARYAWADENGDGRIDAGELRLGALPANVTSATAVNGGYCVRIDRELNAWVGSGSTDRGGLGRVYRPERYTACGAPVWPLAGEEWGPATARRGTTVSALPASGDGGLFVLVHGAGDGTRNSHTYDVATHGWAWPGVTLDGVALLGLAADGTRLWRSGYKAARWPHPRGQLHGAHHLLGVVRDCIAVGDWFEQPCEFWTRDGLYVGGLFDGRNPVDGSLPGSPPDRLYTWLGIKAKRIGINGYGEHSPLAADDLRTGGDVAELPDGSVLYNGQGANNNPLYRISGFDGWQRLSGRVTVSAPAAPAQGRGSGLLAEYFTTPDLTGEPSVRRTDERLWFGAGKPWPTGTPPAAFSVRWTGFLEPRFSEAYCLSVYAQGEFRLWIDGREVTWADQDYPRSREVAKGHSQPIELTAGRQVPIRIEFRARGTAPSFHLNWESLSQPVEHIPAVALYPAGGLAPTNPTNGVR